MTNSQAGQAETDEQTIKLAIAPPQSGAQFETGSTIHERYRVSKLLGRGGMGSVYLVRDLQLQADFALKVLDIHSSDNSARRFEIEAKAASRLDHPNLIKVHDSGLTEFGQPFFVMEYVPGMTLADHLKNRGRLNLTHALSIFIQVGFALAYAHEKGLIHRDLKPGNIMLIENTSGSMCSSIKLVDLGIAKWEVEAESNQQTLTRTGEVIGSPLYMSPEQCMGIAVDRRCDLYSLGCVMYEALTGAPPLMGDNALSTMMKHQTETPLSLKEASMGIEFPQSVELLVAKLLEKEPNKRYSNAQLVTAELVNIQQNLHDAEETQKVDLFRSAQQNKQAVKSNSLFSSGNLVCALIIAAAYGLGYLSGNCIFISAPATAAVKPAAVKTIEQKLAGVPGGYVEFLEGQSPEGKDPYMGTGKGFFTETNGNGTVCHFPNIEIGKIGTVEQNGQPIYRADAKGKKILPSGLLAFEANSELMLYPKMLEKFRPGELGALELQNGNRKATPLLRTLPHQKNLLYLDLSGTWVDNEDIAEIGKLPKLQQLYLSGSEIDPNAVARMKNLTNLKKLDVTESSGVSKLIAALQKSKSITYLKLKKCALKRDDLEAISKIKSLKILDIKNNQAVSDDRLKTIASLKNLKELNLEYCPITARGITQIKALPLKKLTVTNNNFSPAEIKALKSDFRNIVIRPNQRESGTQLHYVLETFEVK